jgi:hypothetical protein
MSERRSDQRTGYSASALVFIANQRYSCVLNLAPTGLLLIPPLREKPGVFVRLNLTLPALDEVIDVDGVIAREGKARGHYAWGIEFVDAPERVKQLIRTYINWARDNAAALQNPNNKLPSSKAQREIDDKATGPAYRAVDTGTYRAVAADAGDNTSEETRIGADDADKDQPSAQQERRARRSGRSPTLPKAQRYRGLGSASSKGAVGNTTGSKPKAKKRRSSPDAGESFEAAELRRLYRDAVREVDKGSDD